MAKRSGTETEWNREEAMERMRSYWQDRRQRAASEHRPVSASSILDRAERLLGHRPEALLGVRAEGKNIARSAWGRAFCQNLERYSDFANRLPRGRTYLRHGHVRHLEIERGAIRALVTGSDLYGQVITIDPLSADRVRDLSIRCAGKIEDAIALVAGHLPAAVMDTLQNPKTGLLPEPNEIDLDCTCPDGAYLCKHLCAVLYGVAVRLDEQPHLLFELRGVNPTDLVAALPSLFRSTPPPPERRLHGNLAELFDLEMAEGTEWASGEAEEPEEPMEDELRLTRAQLLEIGLTDTKIRQWVRDELLVRTRKRGEYELSPAGFEALQPLLEPPSD